MLYFYSSKTYCYYFHALHQPYIAPLSISCFLVHVNAPSPVNVFPLSTFRSLNSTQNLSSFLHASLSSPEKLLDFFTFLSACLIIRKSYKFFNFRSDFPTHSFVHLRYNYTNLFGTSSSLQAPFIKP